MKSRKKLLFLIGCLLSVGCLMVLSTAAATLTYTPSAEYRASHFYADYTSVELTGDQRTDVVLVALSQLGYHEGDKDADMGGGNTKGSKNFVEYNRLFGKVDNDEGNGVSYGYYWCCSFATWCVRQAGVPASILKNEISCDRLIEWLQNNAVYKVSGKGYTPKTGDLIFFKSGSSDRQKASHVGIVMYVDGKTVYTIEGNTTTGNVATKNYSLSDTYIVGYGVPAYTSKPAAAMDFSKKIPGTYFITVTTSALNVRSGPGTSNDAIGSLNSSDRVTVSEISDNGWGKIDYNGKAGWIYLSYAQYVPSARYTIYYNVNGGTGAIPAQPKADGKTTVLTSQKPTRAGYKFSGWATKKDAKVAEYMSGGSFGLNADTTLYAVWSIGEFSVSFYNGDTLIQSGDYSNGSLVSSPNDPVKPADNIYSYKFAGWDINNDGKVDVKPGGSVTASSNVTAKAVYTGEYINYKVTFFGRLGTVISEKADYHYGDTLQIPQVPTVLEGMYSYSFDGWTTKVAEIVTANAEYTVNYKQEIASYKVSFVDGDGNVISEQEYPYGSLVTVPSETPTKSADNTYTYTFRDWDKNIETVTGHTVYTAEFTPVFIEYHVTFFDGNGGKFAEQVCHYGDVPETPEGTPQKMPTEKINYIFNGWDHEFVGITGDTVFNAVFTEEEILYTVTFYNDDGSVYNIVRLHFGDEVIFPDEPKKSGSSEGYVFACWTPEASVVNGNMSFTATYSAADNGETSTGAVTTAGKDDGGCGSLAGFAIVFAVIPAAIIIKKKK